MVTSSSNGKVKALFTVSMPNRKTLDLWGPSFSDKAKLRHDQGCSVKIRKYTALSSFLCKQNKGIGTAGQPWFHGKNSFYQVLFLTFLKNNLKMLAYLLLKVEGHPRAAKEVIHQLPSKSRGSIPSFTSYSSELVRNPPVLIKYIHGEIPSEKKSHMQRWIPHLFSQLTCEEKPKNSIGVSNSISFPLKMVKAEASPSLSGASLPNAHTVICLRSWVHVWNPSTHAEAWEVLRRVTKWVLDQPGSLCLKQNVLKWFSHMPQLEFTSCVQPDLPNQ